MYLESAYLASLHIRIVIRGDSWLGRLAGSFAFEPLITRNKVTRSSGKVRWRALLESWSGRAPRVVDVTRWTDSGNYINLWREAPCRMGFGTRRCTADSKFSVRAAALRHGRCTSRWYKGNRPRLSADEYFERIPSSPSWEAKRCGATVSRDAINPPTTEAGSVLTHADISYLLLDRAISRYRDLFMVVVTCFINTER